MEKAGYDLIVVGGGPAGSACAITAARAGARVLLLEKDKFPRHKVCGEFVSPESLQLLEWLLGKRCFPDKPQIAHARVFSGRKTISLPIDPAAQSIARFELDAALFHAVQSAGAQVLEEITVREVQGGNLFSVKTADKSFSTRAVVNATGRWSELTQKPAIRKQEKWIGLKGHFQEKDPSPTVDLYFFDGGYCGVQPVSDRAVNACAMVRADAARSLEEVFARQPALMQRAQPWQPLFPPITTSPLYFREPQTESGGMVLAGDAAAFIDPFAGDGISLALHSGTLAAECLEGFFQGRCSLEEATRQYDAAYRRQFEPAFRNAARLRMMLSAPPWIRSLLVSLAGTRPFSKAIVKRTRAKKSGDRVSRR